jgi:NADH-quinone oxidoreductase subunit L
METLILFSPLVGAILCGFGWKFIGETAAQWVATGLLFFACVLSWIVFLTHDGVTETINILRWIESGTLSTEWAIRLDRLTATMLIVVTTVSALVHLYSSATWTTTRSGKKAKATSRASLPTCRSSPSPCSCW